MSSLSDYEVLEHVGSGSFGKVSKIKRKKDNKILVWKEIHYGEMSEREKALLVSEVNIIKSFQNPYIVKYYDRIIEREKKTIFIVMEFCPCGDLSKLIKGYNSAKKRMDEDFIWLVLTHMCIALYECHTKAEGKIMHRDIKPGNILLHSKFHFKLGDFGLARILSDQSTFARTNVGTPYYMSPEQIDGKAYNERSDIWSLGCVMYELCMLHPPFEANNALALALRIKNCSRQAVDTKHYSRDLINVINYMMNIDPDKRPRVEQLMKVQQISVRIWEIRLQEKMLKIRMMKDDMKKRDISLNNRQRLLEDRERDLQKRENVLAEATANHHHPLSRAISMGNLLNGTSNTPLGPRTNNNMIPEQHMTHTLQQQQQHNQHHKQRSSSDSCKEDDSSYESHSTHNKENTNISSVSTMFKNFRVGRF